QPVEVCPHATGDSDGLQTNGPAVCQPKTGYFVVGYFDGCNRGIDARDAHGGKCAQGLGIEFETVAKQCDILGPLLKQHGLVGRGRTGGDDAKSLVPDFPAVTIRAVDDFAPPPSAKPVDVG